MSKSYNVAVVGCDTLVGEAVLNLLEERAVPVAMVHAVALEGGGRVAFKGKQLKVAPLADFDFSQAQLAFFCADDAVAEAYVAKATAAGCVVIDDSPCFRLEDEVPLVVPEVNPEALAGYAKQKLVANPGTNATLLTTVLKPLQQAAGIAHVDVVALQAVSGKDKAGVEELARQATAMFNLKTIENSVFDKQIAFNLLPQIGAILDDGSTREEAKLAWEAARILGQDDLPLNATCVRVPVFYGHALVLHVETQRDLSLDEAQALLQAAPGVTLMTEREYPTAVSEAAGNDTVFVGRLRRDQTRPRGLDLWVVADNIRKGAALNSIQIAEYLLKDYLG
ncbi:aspartate-semialdehyde dehydrogenase [Candidatus Tenderia electrophaga]|jgi:aspartate-semialdehyde dehydrogenase|uniref:Aspartate-semialdehyde dehydrogenase n=1 Tax=Candidatus Tenderia electrophaga TaxID=1748243 RepID=A0A0S2TBM6_9GAMM|nr:aspartate-semialdehyde dehydrogenase [Candidatus Tenderia electrophaga]